MCNKYLKPVPVVLVFILLSAFLLADTWEETSTADFSSGTAVNTEVAADSVQIAMQSDWWNPAADWWSGGSSWQYRRAVTINNAGSSALSDYQIMVQNPVYNDSGLVGSWHFEEGSGTSVADTSGFANNGTWNGSGSHWTASGKAGNAGTFNGSNDYVSVPNSASLNPAYQITMSAWIKPVNITGVGYMEIIRQEGSNRKLFSFQNNGAYLTLGLTTGGAYWETDFPITASYYTDGNWHYVVYTYDGSYARMYVDGVLNNQQAHSGTIGAETANLLIGSYSGSSEFFNGTMDEVRMYSRALTLDEILAQYQAKMKLNYGDIRFTNSAGTELPYYTERDGVFWVKVTGSDSIPAGLSNIFMYYGNSSAVSQSNQGSTMIVDTSTGFKAPVPKGSLSNGNRTWSAGSNYSSVVLDKTFTGGYFEMVTYWAHDYRGVGMVYGPNVSHSDWTGWSNDGLGPYWGALNTSGFPSGYSGTFYGQYHAPLTGQGALTTGYYYKQKRNGNILSLQYSTQSSSGPWSNFDAAPATSIFTTDKVAIGLGEASNTEVTPLSIISLVYSQATASPKPDVDVGSEVSQTSQWLYRKPLTVNNTGSSALTDYQVKIANPVYNESGLVGSWHFDLATSGSIINTSTTGMQDSSGYNYSGTVSNNNASGMAWASGRCDGAVTFDGTDDYVNTADIDVNNITVAAWVYPTKADPGSYWAGMIISKDENSPNRNWALYQQWNAGVSSITFAASTNGTGVTQASASGFTINTWHYVVGTYDGSNVRIYVDSGTPLSEPALTGNIFNNTRTVTIGTRLLGGAVDSPFKGVIDEVKIYNRALSGTEISDRFAAKAKLNYGDIRFTGNSGIEFPYWMEKDGTFWVKVLGANSLAVGNNTLYAYYGNSVVSGTVNFGTAFTKDFGDTGLLGLWHLDDAVTGTAVTDWSGNSKTGTMNNFASPNGWYYSDGGQWGTRSDVRFPSGSCLNFDGSNDNVSIGSLGSFPAQGTLEFWMNASEMANYRNPVTTKYNGGNACIRFEENSSGNFVVATGNDGGTFDAATYVASGMQINTWYHVVYVWNTSANTETGYLNGAQVFSNSHTYWPTTIPDFRIGTGYDTSAGRQWKGLLDEVRIYNRAITANEAKAHYERRRPSGLVATLQPGSEGKDAYVRINDDWDGYVNTVNHGSETSLEFRLFNVDSYDRRIFIKFDNLPSSTINNAQLKLYMWDNGSGNFGTRTVVVRKTTSTWDESTVTAAAQPSYGTSDYASISVSSLGWYTWDITSLANEWVSSPSTDYGLMMRVSTPTGNWYSANFYSSDYSGDTSLRPKLELSVEPYSVSAGSEQNPYNSSGSFKSSVKDTTADGSIIKSVAWTATGSGALAMQVRASDSNTGWTDISPAWEDVDNGDTFVTSAGRYLQYKAVFTGDSSSADPVLTDVTILYNCLPSTPANTSPADAIQLDTLTPLLGSSAFSDPNAGDTHVASQWQVTSSAGDYSAPVYDSGETAVDLAALAMSSGSVNDDGTVYYWHVRHKDSGGDWSAYSSETSFSIIPPEIVSAFVADTDYDDKLDVLQVYTDEDVLGTTTSVTAGAGFTLTGSGYVYTILSGTEIAAGVIKFGLAEKTSSDLSSTFTLDYSSAAGNLVDVDGLASKVAAVTSLSVSVNTLKVTEFSCTDLNNNGKLDILTLAFNNNISGAGDIADWQVTDADGITNLIAGLANSNISYSQNKIYITLPDLTGTAGVPDLVYNPDGSNNIVDAGGVSLYSFSTLYDTAAPLAPQAVSPENGASFESTSVVFSWTAVTDLTGVSYSIEIDDSNSFTLPLTGSSSGMIGIGTTVALSAPGTYYWHVKAVDGNNNSSDWSNPFSFTIATQGSGDTGTGDGDAGGDNGDTGGVNLPVDASIVADAGTNQVKQPTVIYLDGSASTNTDGSNSGLSYEWTLLSSPSQITPQLLNSLTSAPYFIASAAGDYVFQLTVYTQTAMSNPDTVTVTITDVVPFADAGPDRTLENGPVITLDGSDSRDTNGDELSYLWSQIGGPAVLIESADTVTAGFSSLNTIGTLEFMLAVTDPAGNTAEDTVYITLNSTTDTVPVADAGVQQIAAKNSTVQLTGIFSIDAESQELSYYWTQVSGPADVVLSNVNSASPEFVPEVSGIYTFELVVSDGVSYSAPNTVTVVVNGSSNNLPLAVAKMLFPSGGNPVVGQQVILSAGESTDSDGDILSYMWEQVYGQLLALSGTDSEYLVFFPVASGNYKFRLSVSDGKVDAGIDDEIEVVVLPSQDYDAPEAVIELDSSLDPDGDLRIFSSSATVLLDGSQSTGEGVLEYMWTQIQGPAVILDGDNGPAVSFQPQVAYTYGFRLSVTDADGLKDYEDFFVVIDTEANGVPKASAGDDITGNPGSVIHLDASNSSDPEWDPDGLSGSAGLTYVWEQISGTPVVLYDTDTEFPYFVSYVPGEYKFKVYVNDGMSISLADEVVVTVKASTMTTGTATTGTTTDTTGTGNAGTDAVVNQEDLETDGGLNSVLGSQQETRMKGCFIRLLRTGRLGN